jgi:ankyrin repeat protein
VSRAKLSLRKTGDMHLFPRRALHLAASMASIEPLKLLLSLGFDPDGVNESKETPLFIAARTNNIDAACVLIASGIDYRCKNIRGMSHLSDVEIQLLNVD